MKRIRGYRITKTRYLDQAFTGNGARRYGGRWNAKGTPVIYASSGIALATLEILVHAGPVARIAHLFSVCPFEFDAKHLADAGPLDPAWRETDATIEAGNRWIQNSASLVLRVPSVVLDLPIESAESNYLINPEHEGFEEIERLEPFPLRLDPRL